MKNNYYVYMYRCSDDIPFYVGMGCNNRYYVSNHYSQPFLNNKIKKVGKKNIKIHFFNENLTEEKALEWERYWIKYIGRRDTGEGTLCNLTDGGDCIASHAPGKKHTEEAKLKIGDAARGRRMSEATKNKLRQINLGKKLSEEHKLKMSVSQKRRWQNKLTQGS